MGGRGRLAAGWAGVGRAAVSPFATFADIRQAAVSPFATRADVGKAAVPPIATHADVGGASVSRCAPRADVSARMLPPPHAQARACEAMRDDHGATRRGNARAPVHHVVGHSIDRHRSTKSRSVNHHHFNHGGTEHLALQILPTCARSSNSSQVAVVCTSGPTKTRQPARTPQLHEPAAK